MLQTSDGHRPKEGVVRLQHVLVASLSRIEERFRVIVHVGILAKQQQQPCEIRILCVDVQLVVEFLCTTRELQARNGQSQFRRTNLNAILLSGSFNATTKENSREDGSGAGHDNLGTGTNQGFEAIRQQ